MTVNGRFLSQPVTGVQRVARETVRAIDAALDDPALRARWSFEIVAPADAAAWPELRHVGVTRGGVFRGHAWEQLVLPAVAGSSTLLSLANTAPLGGRTTVVVVHDAGVWAIPEAYSPAFRSLYRALIPRVARRARRVVTVSEFSARELDRYAGIARDRQTVVPPGADHITRAPPDASVIQRLGLRAGEYVLAVGSASRHKNLAVIAAAVETPPLAGVTLVVVGDAGHRAFGGTPRPTGDHVRQAGRVSDPELRALYAGAICLAFPSRYEGFGLPPLEAMACGCPVLVGAAAALREGCGDAALAVPGEEPAAWAGEIARLRGSPALALAMTERGRARAAAFRWERTALAMLAVLEAAA